MKGGDNGSDSEEGDVLTVEFTVMGIPCIGLNGGGAFRQITPSALTQAINGPDPAIEAARRG